MKNLAIGGYAEADVLAVLRGKYGRRELKFRYELLSSAGTVKKTLGNVEAGSIRHDSEAQIKRTARFDIVEDGSIIYLSDRIKPYIQFRMLDGIWLEWPLGVFLLTTPKVQADISGVVRRGIEAYDPTIVLVEDTVSNRYYVGQNALYTDAIIELLSNTLGIWTWNVTASTARLPTAKEWDPGTSKYDIISDLTNAIGYNSIWFDGSGVAQVKPWINPNDRTVEFQYLTDDVSVTLPDASQTLDLFGRPNRWVFYVSNPDRPALRVERTNNNPASPTSIVSRGRTITAMVPVDDAVDLFVLGQIADQRVLGSTMVYDEVEFSTGLMPHHENLDLYTIGYDDLTVSGNYVEVTWEMPLEQGGAMTHKARKVVQII
jgi:hypothetical protein